MKRKSVGKRRIYGTKNEPRLSVFRSNKHIYIQAVDDDANKTLMSYSDLKLTKSSKSGANKTKIASEVGKEFGKLLNKGGVKQVKFDRNGYRFHGRVKALAEGVRQQGIDF